MLLPFETARHIYEEDIEKSQCAELRRELCEKAIIYARLRTDCWRLDLEGRQALDPRRRAAHNTFIDACNILSRTMQSRGESNAWRATLGNDRKTLGDFACHLHAILGLLAR